MSLYRRKDSPCWWVKLPPIRGESKPLQQSTGTADKRQAQQVHDKLAAAERDWEQNFGRYREAREIAANVIDIAHASGVDKVGLITAKIEAGP